MCIDGSAAGLGRVKDPIIVKFLGGRAVEFSDPRLRDLLQAHGADALQLAEFGIGTNPRAGIVGNVLEDEKAGFHWAYGRSDHLGGKIGLRDFKTPANVVHNDVVYAKESPISIARAELVDADGRRTVVIDGGDYRLW